MLSRQEKYDEKMSFKNAKKRTNSKANIMLSISFVWPSKNKPIGKRIRVITID